MVDIQVWLKRMVTGRFSPSTSMLWAPLSSLIFASFLIWSWSFYPGEYSIFSNAVSNLGDPFLNPWPGWVIFSVGILVYGCLMAPNSVYLFRAFVASNRSAGRRFLVASLVGYAGYVGVGLFPEAPSTFIPHAIAAMMAFVGLVVAAVVLWFPTIERIKQAKQSRANSGCIIFLSVTVLFIALSYSMTMLSLFLLTMGGIFEHIFLSMSFWEWMLVGSLAVHAIFITAIVNARAV